MRAQDALTVSLRTPLGNKWVQSSKSKHASAREEIKWQIQRPVFCSGWPGSGKCRPGRCCRGPRAWSYCRGRTPCCETRDREWEVRQVTPSRSSADPCRAHLILQPVAPPPHVHLSGIVVVEAALTQLAVEPDHFALVVAHLTHKAQLRGASLRPPRVLRLPELPREVDSTASYLSGCFKE